MRSRYRALILVAICVVAFSGMANAQDSVEVAWTWTDAGTEGWGHDSSEVTLSNPGGYLKMGFWEQTAPMSVADITRANVEEGLLPYEISFRFQAFDMKASAVRLYLHSKESGNHWYVSLPPPEADGWYVITVPVEFAAGWIIGRRNSEQQFLRDIRSIDWVGVYVRRHGDVAAQSYAIDDFTINGVMMGANVDGEYDTDVDGMPDVWEIDNELNPTNALDAELDSDNDGLVNKDEYTVGSNPNDPKSLFEIDIALADESMGLDSESPAPFVLRWDSFVGRWYTVWRSTNLASGFVVLESDIEATPPENVYVDETAITTGLYFYKVEVTNEAP